MVEISTTLKDLQDTGVVCLSYPYSFNSLLWSLEKPNRPYRMEVDYYKLNKVIVPVSAAVLVVVSVLELINTVSGSWEADIDLRSAFFPPPLRKTIS